MVRYSQGASAVAVAADASLRTRGPILPLLLLLQLFTAAVPLISQHLHSLLLATVTAAVYHHPSLTDYSHLHLVATTTIAAVGGYY